MEMLYAIWFVGGPKTEEVRTLHRAEHLRFVIERIDVFAFGGACLNQARDEMAGMLMVIKASDRAEAEAFVASEPYSRAGAFSAISIMPFSERVPERHEGFLRAELAAEETRTRPSY